MPTTLEAIDLPFEEAISFFRQKANVGTKSYRDVWGAAHSKAFMVSGAMSKDLVQAFRNEIDRALSEGTTLADFRKSFDGIVAKHGWSFKGDRDWRTKIIFDTNIRTAHAAGRYAQLTKPGSLIAFPYWQYNHSGALHPRRNHLSWNGTVLPADDPFWQTNYPPNGFNCGCFVTPVSDAGLRRQGKSGPDASPNLEQLDGSVRGADAGFDYNPGQAWLRQTAPRREAVAADEVEVAAFVRSAIAGKRPAESWTSVTIADDKIAAALSVPTKTEFRLSAKTVIEYLKLSRTQPATYAVILRRLIETGTIVQRADGRILLVAEIGEQFWNAEIKIVRKEGRVEIYLQTLRSSNPKQIRRWIRAGIVLRR